MSPPAYIKYLSLTPRVESLQCIHVDDQEGLCFCTLEQNRPYQCLVHLYFGADTERTACSSIPSVENSSLNRQVQSCVEHPVGSIAIRTLLTAKVDELLYSFNWYTIYEDCRRYVGHLHPDNFKPSGRAAKALIGRHCLLGADQT